MCKADALAAAAAERACFDSPWSEQQIVSSLQQAGALGLAADDDDAGLAGFALARVVADEAEVLRMAVVPPWQRKGIGRALLSRLLDRLADSGAGAIYLEVDSGNTAAVGLYRRAGFREHAARRGYYGPRGGDALVMAWRPAGGSEVGL